MTLPSLQNDASTRPVEHGVRARFLGWLGTFVGGLLLVGCAPTDPAPLRLTGVTMGTHWTATVVPSPGARRVLEVASIQQAIQEELDEVDRVMSTWKPESDLSRWNGLGAGEGSVFGEELLEVLGAAQQVYEASGGAFDPTVGELVSLWGFGAGGGEDPVEPSAEALERARGRIGLDGVEVGVEGQVTKRREGLELDLSAIAKGFAVDEAGRALERLGVDGYFLEVGGEVRVAGRSPRGDAWRIGIDRPTEERDEARTAGFALELGEGSVATSGDYRNWRMVGGRRVAHTIDPRTGRPVEHAPASVSVVGPSCALADALATAATVLGPEGGLEVVSRFDGYEVLFLVSPGDGEPLDRSGSPSLLGRLIVLDGDRR